MLKRKVIFYLIIFLFIFPLQLHSKDMIFRVFYRDKGPEQLVKGSDLYHQTLSLLSQRAIKRRLKVRTDDNLITIEDAPVYKDYLNKLLKFDVKLIHNLRWLNYSVFSCDSVIYDSLITRINEFDFIKKTELVCIKSDVEKQKDKLAQNEKKRKFNKRDLFIQNHINPDRQDIYGDSYSQVSAISADKLHDLGITGDSVLIGLLDSGFDWKHHNSIKNSNIIAEYDFIQLDDVTANEKDDIKGQDGHGTLVLSSIAGILPGKLIGIAPTSSFAIAKTEAIPYEIPLEEDNYAAAIEWLEALGVDITSSSLAYKFFDEPFEDYNIDIDFDGKTTLSSIYINKAVSRGVVCLTAAGNTGPEAETLHTPGDADSAITCGAVKFVNNMIVPAKFSSRGPRSDSIVKPDIAAPGVGIICAGKKDTAQLIKANGTSLSTPLTAGAVALLLTCFPDLRPWEIRNLLYSTAHNFPKKNNSIGYGLIDIWSATKKAGTIISPPTIYRIADYLRFSFYIVPNGELIETPYLIVNINGLDKKFYLYETEKDYKYVAHIPLKVLGRNKAVASLIVTTSKSERRYPYDNSYMIFSSNTVRINKLSEITDPIISVNKSGLLVRPSTVNDESDYIDIYYDLNSSSSIWFNLYSVEGRKIVTKHIPFRQRGVICERFDIGNLPNGFYYINIYAKGSKAREKFLILR